MDPQVQPGNPGPYQQMTAPQPQSEVPTPNQQPPYPSTTPQPSAPGGLFERRLSRSGVWFFVLYVFLVLLVSVVPEFVVSIMQQQSFQSSGTNNLFLSILTIIFSTLFLIVFVAMIPLSISVWVRRLHDTNHSGWFYLLSFVPLVNLALLGYMLFAPGTAGSNQYGEPIGSRNFWVVLGLKKP